MLVDRARWRERKRRFWRRLWEDLEIGYLDEDLLPLLLVLNTDKHIYTMSSCSGRIVFSDSTYPWSREETSIVFKKHSPITVEEVRPIIEKPSVRRLWVNVTGPIIHLSTDSLEYALQVLGTARRAGYKHSGLMSINHAKGVLLELTTGVYMSQLVKSGEKLVVPGERLDIIISIINDVLLRGKKFLDRLYREFINQGYGLDEEIVADMEARGFRLDELLQGSPYKYS